MSEIEIIERVFAPLVRRAGALGLRDDCASYVPGPGQEVVLKTDPIREGVHFFASDPPAAIAWKALAVGVSDLAAKAARPTAYLCAVSFPERPADDWLDAFGAGLHEAQDAFGMSLMGGDTDRTPGPISIAITVFGECPVGRMIQRGMAMPGDQLFVSGTLGEAAAGLALHSGKLEAPQNSAAASAAIDRFLRPQPRLGLKAALRRYARAAMDLSDGLVKDAGRMARASQCRFEFDATLLPRADVLDVLKLSDIQLQQWLLAHGDDYEVLAAIPSSDADDFTALAEAGGVPVTHIGQATDRDGVIVRDQSGAAIDLKSTGWDHF